MPFFKNVAVKSSQNPYEFRRARYELGEDLHAFFLFFKCWLLCLSSAVSGESLTDRRDESLLLKMPMGRCENGCKLI